MGSRGCAHRSRLFVLGEALRAPDDALGLLRAPSRIPVAGRFRLCRRDARLAQGLAALAAAARCAQWMGSPSHRAVLLSSPLHAARRWPGPGPLRAHEGDDVGRPRGPALGRALEGGPATRVRPSRPVGRLRSPACPLELGDPLAHRALQATAARGGHRAQAARAGAGARGRHGGGLLGARGAHHRGRLARAEDAAAAARLEQGERHRGHRHARRARLRVAPAGAGGPARGGRRPRADRALAGRAALPRALRARQAAFDALDECEKRTFSELCRKLAA